jgi:hypothetical protein
VSPRRDTGRTEFVVPVVDVGARGTNVLRIIVLETSLHLNTAQPKELRIA